MRRAVVAVALVAAGLVLGGQHARAHAVLEASDPAAGGQVDAAPAEVVLDFTERPDPALASVRVLDRAGAAVGTDEPTVDPAAPTVLRVGLPSIDDGSYTVTWRVTSVEDGHTTAGSFAFGVGQPPSEEALASAATAPRTPRPGPVGVVGRAAMYAGTAALLGAAAIGLTVLRRRSPPPRRGLVVAWLVSATGVVLLVIDEARRSGTSVVRFLDSDTGERLVLLTAAMVLGGGAVALYARWPGRRALTAVGCAAAAVFLARSAGGHAGGSSSLAVGIQWVHLLGVGAWVGGLGWLLQALRRAEAADRVPMARRFSALAATCLAVVVLTGTLRAVDEAASWRLLVDSAFGQTLLVKLAVVAVVVAVAAANRLRLAHAATPGWLRLAGAEVGGGAVVLAVTAVLAGLAPATSAGLPPPAPPPRVVAEGADFATLFRVTLVAAPGTVGGNTFRLDVRDYDTDEQVDVRSATLRFRLPSRPQIAPSMLELGRAPDGRWRGDAASLAVMGTWEVTAIVMTGDRGVEIPLRLRPRLPGQRIEAVETPGEPTIYTVVLAGGDRVQGYADPATSGFNEVHVTAFSPSGDELPLAGATVTATGPDARDQTLEVRRFGPGHFVTDADLEPGRWDFLAVLQTEDGRELTVDFPTDVR